MTNEQRIKKLQKILDEIEVYSHCIGKVQYDMECVAPEEGIEQAGDEMAVLSQLVFKLTHSRTYVNLLTELHEDPSGLDPIHLRLVEVLWRSWCREKNFTAAFSYETDVLSNRAYGDWLKAKKANDYSLFAPTLGQLTDRIREMTALRGEHSGTVYDVWLDDNEPGSSQKRLDEFFASLQARITPLVQRIVSEGKTLREDFMTRPCPISQQEKFSRWLMDLEGLRPTATVLGTTEHPFTDSFGPNDVRITTHYYEDNFISNVFTTMHEGGHAIFMQNEPAELYAAHVDNSMTNGMHECISRFYENLIARSEPFIHFIMPKLRELSGDTFADVSEREMYEAVNAVHPSLIRTESDELTYCLHIMVRYELEKGLINGDISAKDVPALWNEKMKTLLGVDVPDDAQGCLQDVHWAGAFGFGYFPSYALGNAYGAQIMRRMRNEMDVDAVIAAGELWRVRDWLKENVFSCASMLDPDEWIVAVTGEPLNVNYYLDYMEQKFSALYELK